MLRGKQAHVTGRLLSHPSGVQSPSSFCCCSLSKQAGTNPGAREVHPRPEQPLGRTERGSGRFWGASPRPPACPEEAIHMGRGWIAWVLALHSSGTHLPGPLLWEVPPKLLSRDRHGSDTSRTLGSPGVSQGRGLPPCSSRCPDGSLVCCCCLGSPVTPPGPASLLGTPGSAGEGHWQDPGAA